MVAQLDPAYAAAGGSRLVRLASWSLFEGRPLSTRGRAWNPAVLAVHHLHRLLPRLAAVRRPIFVVGVGRTGSTLLARLLSIDPEVAFLNEPKALWHVGVGGEDVVGSYSRGPARYRLSADDLGPGISLERLYGACLFWTRRSRLLDKNQEIVYRIPFVRALFPDALFLVPVRDGPEVVRSIDAWSRRHAVRRRGETHDWWGADRRKWRLLLDQVVADEPDLLPGIDEMSGWTDQRWMAAVEWIVAMRYAQRARRAEPGSIRFVRYDELVAAPARTLDGVAGFCGLEAAPAIVAYGERIVGRRPASGGADDGRIELPARLRAAFDSTRHSLGYALG